MEYGRRYTSERIEFEAQTEDMIDDAWEDGYQFSCIEEAMSWYDTLMEIRTLFERTAPELGEDGFLS